MSQSAALAGFCDPTHATQHTFRAALEALARPGSRHGCVAPREQPPAIGAASIALAMTLADRDTPVWLGYGEASDAIGDYLRFHAGCRIANQPGDAAFALAAAMDIPELLIFQPGQTDRPDLSATVIMQVTSLHTGTRLRLSGPGIDGHRLVACAGLPTRFIAQCSNNRERFPRGVDLFLTADDTFIGLPRTTTIEEV